MTQVRQFLWIATPNQGKSLFTGRTAVLLCNVSRSIQTRPRRTWSVGIISTTRLMSPTNPIARYLLSSWTQTCGVGWTPRQITFAHATAIALTVAVLLAAYANDLDWSWLQYVVAALLARDLLLGVIGYSHSAIKRRRSQESGNLPVWHHNLQHIHPLIASSSQTS